MSENQSFKSVKEENLLFDMETQNLVLSKVKRVVAFQLQLFSRKKL